MPVSPQANITQNGRSSDFVADLSRLPEIDVKRMTRITSSDIGE